MLIFVALRSVGDAMISQQQHEQYSKLRDGAGFVWHADRTLLRFTGPDAAKFLHNFCTANVNELPVGGVTEAFVLDSRGKTLSFGHILRFESELFWSAADKTHSQGLSDHLNKYIIREDVAVEDLSDSWCASVSSVGATPGSGQLELNRCSKSEDDRTVAAVAEFAGHCCLHLTELASREHLSKRLQETGSECSLDSLNMIRVEFGTPWFGVEVDTSNLPQELRRDEKAISFTKGCYLGQETVAKIDAIGHVNRFLVGVKTEHEQAQPGTEIVVDDRVVGELRSVAWSPKLGVRLGLGYIKRQFAKPEGMVQLGGGQGELVELPV